MSKDRETYKGVKSLVCKQNEDKTYKCELNLGFKKDGKSEKTKKFDGIQQINFSQPVTNLHTFYIDYFPEPEMIFVFEPESVCTILGKKDDSSAFYIPKKRLLCRSEDQKPLWAEKLE